MKLILSATLLLLGFVSVSFSQLKNPPTPLLITTEQTTFRIGENTKVKLIFENRTGKKVNPANDLAVKFTLQRTSVINWDCSWNTCYWAFPFDEFKSKVEIPNRGVFETEVDLADLFWMDALDSNVRINRETIRENNFFKEIMSGNFNLKAELYCFPSSTKTFESNKILITIETEKKYRK